MMLYRLYLRGMEIAMPIGIHDFEIAAKQRIRIDIAVAVCADLDLITPSTMFDYDLVRDGINALAAGGQIALQEHLCQKILDLCRAQSGVKGVVVRSAKPDVYPDVTEVGCCIEWGEASIADLAALCDRTS